MMHTDPLLREHRLLLDLHEDGGTPSLHDWKTGEPASPWRVRAYLDALGSKPGFPGPDVAFALGASIEGAVSS